MTKFSKKILCLGFMSVVLSFSLQAAGIGKVYTSQSPEEETRQRRQELLSTLKDISNSFEERVRFEGIKTSILRFLVEEIRSRKQVKKVDQN